MAGTLTIGTLSDGTNSASATDAIKGSARAWVNFNGVTTATIRASYNVSSVTRNGTGDYTVNFTNALADANYSAAISCKTDGVTDIIAQVPGTGAKTTSSLRIQSVNAAGTLRDSQTNDVAIFR